MSDYSPVSVSVPDIDSSLYHDFIARGFQRQRIELPERRSDPTLRLAIHVLSRQACSGHQDGAPSRESSSVSTLLLIHGHPQSALIWRHIVPLLPSSVQIVIPDLRGHGLSDAPPIERDQVGDYANEVMAARYSKREMARDIVELVKLLGGREDGKWAVVGHDRGGRVAHRMALDYPDLLSHVLVLDIAPTLDMYKRTTAEFARAYWHWFFLIQPFPFPEELILANPAGYLEKMTSRLIAGPPSSSDPVHPPALLASYRATLAKPLYAQATCEDYRCAAMGGSDWIADQDSRDRGEKVKPPLRVLWGEKGVVHKMYGRRGVLDMWQAQCSSFDSIGSKSMPGGHYLPEELPKEVMNEITDFLRL